MKPSNNDKKGRNRSGPIEFVRPKKKMQNVNKKGSSDWPTKASPLPVQKQARSRLRHRFERIDKTAPISRIARPRMRRRAPRLKSRPLEQKLSKKLRLKSKLSRKRRLRNAESSSKF